MNRNPADESPHRSLPRTPARRSWGAGLRALRRWPGVHRLGSRRLVPLHGTGTVFIDPGLAGESAWLESFNGRVRDEHLNRPSHSRRIEQPPQPPPTSTHTFTSPQPTGTSARPPNPRHYPPCPPPEWLRSG